MKVLAVGAHPDDIEIFMYGLLAECKKLGYELSLIISTDGSLGGAEKPEILKEKRKQETIDGLSELGTPIFLDLPDGRLGTDPKHLIYLSDSIKKIKPNIIITHANNDYHTDHRIVSNYVTMAAGHYIPVLYCDTLMGINFNPNYYINITDVFSLKEKAILSHKTQKPDRFVKLARLMNSYRSAQCNSPLGTYAEAYKFKNSFPFSDIKDILPSSPALLPFEINNKNGFL